MENKCTRDYIIIKNLFSYKDYGGPHKGGYGIANCNSRCTYCPLVPKRDTFYVTDGSPMLIIYGLKNL